MRTNRITITVLMAMSLHSIVGSSQEPAGEPDKIAVKEQPKFEAIGYKGGLPFYTAFHQKWTTRFLLLGATVDIPELKQYLRISDTQADQIGDLELFEGGGMPDALRSKLLDDNIAIDEEKADPEFYAFLDKTQRERLDRLALEFDGSSGLSLVSIADRLRLSKETRRSVEKTLVKYREELFIPYFRSCFAGIPLPDHEYRDCDFSGRYLVLLNQSILKNLTREERNRHDEWALRTAPPFKVIQAIKRKAPLPGGLFALAKQKEE